MDSEALFQEFLRLDHQIDEFYHELAARLGLSDSAFQVLWSVAELGEGCTQRDVCRFFSVSKQTTHSAIQKLRQQGYLSLEPGKGRNMHIRLTEAGRQVVRRVVLPVRRLEEAALEELGSQGSRELLNLTGRYVAAYQALAREYIRRLRQDQPH